MMTLKKIQFLAAVFAALFSVGHAKPPQRIIEGEIVRDVEFPHQVYIDILNGGVCGGTILDSINILTAAHCIRPYGSLLTNEDFLVITGTNDREDRTDENVFRVVEAIHHPNYNTSGYVNDDIAILKLDRPIPFNYYQAPARLPEKDVAAHSLVMASGWGVTKINGTYPRYLKKLEKIVLSQEECDSLLQPFKWDSSQICAGTSMQGDVCTGDSGGPLTLVNTVIGIASRSSCNRGFPTVYTRVYKYLDWIRRIMRTRASNVW